MSSFVSDVVTNQIAGLFKILNLLLQSRQRDSVHSFISKIEGLVLENRHYSTAKMCILQGEKLLLLQPFDDLSNSTGARLLLLGLKMQKILPASTDNGYIHTNYAHNQHLIWLEYIKPTNLELIVEVVEAMNRAWQHVGTFSASHLTPTGTLADSKQSFKQRCLRDCAYFFERLSSTALDIQFNNGWYLVSILPKEVINDLKSLLKIGIATKDDAAVERLLCRCSAWKMNSKSGELLLWMLKSLCHSHRYKSIMDASHFMILKLLDNLILSIDEVARFHDGKKQISQADNGVQLAVYFDIILYILISQPTNKIFLSCKCEEYLMRLMNVCISNVNGSRTKGTPMSVPLYQIANFVRTLVFVYQDVVSRDMENAWRNFTSHAKDICTPAEVKRKTLGRQIDSFRMCFWGASHSSNDRVGLQNEGNTCYQNAILQILFMSDSFANAILSINLLDLRKNFRALQLAQSMRKIFSMLIFSHRPYIAGDTINNFRSKLCVPFNGFKQQDASEFLYSLIDNILMNFNVPRVEKIFRGKFETRICCKRCKNVVSSLFPFLGIQVAFPTEVNAEEKSTVTGHKVSDLLQQFCGPELLEGSNAYFCERCNAKVCAIKQTVVAETPEILVITIKRFYYDMSGTISGKICHPLNIEPTIQVRDKLFDLYGVVTHHGSSLNSGHYTATASHSKSCDAKWWHFDDSVVKRLDSTTIHNIKDAYMLFYKKRDGFPPTDAVDSSHQQERIMEEPNSSLHYYTPLSSDMLESIRYDNCKYLLELFFSADSTSTSKSDRTFRT